MTGSAFALFLIVVSAIAVIAVWIGFDRLLTTWSGRLWILGALCILPVATWLNTTRESISQSSTTQFCLSCHEMTAFGHTLMIDDSEFVAAVHFQNNLVPQDKACYTCHTNYGMFGGAKAKLNGLRHMWVHYLGEIPEPHEMETYTPYSNANCLHCHRESRRFLDEGRHDSKENPMAGILADEISCLNSGCHDLVHPTDKLEQFHYWRPERMPPALGSFDLLDESETGQEMDIDDLF